ncbi:MAG: nuclear transport factor 2 family protein [Bacteroidetes bacterium]|nr:nuclear transport factor 2 family protein [Bacteroidota bacterium]
MLKQIPLLLPLLVLLNCRQEAPGSMNENERSIRAARTELNKAIAAHDTVTLAKYWTDDYNIVSSRNSHRTGKALNIRFFTEEFDAKPDVVYIRNTDKIEVFEPWNMAAENGHWEGTWTENGSPIKLTGSYYAKWHKVGGQWLIRAEIFVPLSCSGGELCSKSPI